MLPEKFQGVPPIRRRFIDRLDRLKRQRHPQRRDAVARAIIEIAELGFGQYILRVENDDLIFSFDASISSGLQMPGNFLRFPVACNRRELDLDAGFSQSHFSAR